MAARNETSLLSLTYAHVLAVLKRSGTLAEATRAIEPLAQAMSRGPVEESGPHKSRKKGYFEQLGAHILDQVERAVSREALLEETLRILSDDPESRVAQCHLILEAFLTKDDQLLDLRVVLQNGIHPQRMANFERKKLPQLAESTLVRDVMINGETVEFLPTQFVRDISYFGEFDDLDDGRGKGVWLCALPLPAGDVTRPVRMLVALYPMAGSTDAPAAPRGSMQEWRSLSFLRVAYEMLNHQLATTRERVIAQRRQILSDLAPGLVNHEINQQLTTLDESSNLVNWAVHKLAPQFAEDDTVFNALISALGNTLNSVTRLHRIADAFNNMERRPNALPVSIGTILDEGSELIAHRLSSVGANLQIVGPKSLIIITDTALLGHVFINVIANAIEEMEFRNKDYSAKPAILIAIAEQGGRMSVEICNNGPAIKLTRPDRIFEKGFSTKARSRGHGLGLHICRMIMTYLDGSIDLMPSDALPAGMLVGFRIVFPVERTVEEDITDSF